MSDNLTIESCVELFVQHGAEPQEFTGNDNNKHVEYSALPDELLAYSQALEARVTAKWQAVLERRDLQHDETVTGHINSNMELMEELAGCQEMLRQKDEALRLSIIIIDGALFAGHELNENGKEKLLSVRSAVSDKE